LEGLQKAGTDSSSKPHIPDEGMTFYEKLGKKTPEVAEKAVPETKEIVETVSTTEKAVPIPTAVPTNAPPLKPGEGYSIQVSALTEKNDAQTEVDRLKSKGFPAFVSQKTFKNNKVNYRVRVGPYATRSQAEEIAKQIEKEERKSTWVADEKSKD
jgi:cell division septation protein DedD